MGCRVKQPTKTNKRKQNFYVEKNLFVNNVDKHANMVMSNVNMESSVVISRYKHKCYYKRCRYKHKCCFKCCRYKCKYGYIIMLNFNLILTKVLLLLKKYFNIETKITY